ncbi:Peroxisome biosynthesis protein pex1 [Malassezia cuniculi]|uniref:Peroxisomal ATPase PEX1 n=1 Tax=Malassezia cuniculi TaxID=948313 RepID=A0AAF0EXE4_9BASI|nr:Peroxisome biosynthesis protein pex1 [Malassezia cuniculi]
MSTPRTRATAASVRIDTSLRSALVHLPVPLYTTLLSRDVVPQSLVVELGTDDDTYYCGWTGLSAQPEVLGDPRLNTKDQVAIGPTLASLFSPPLTDGSNVSIRLFRSPPVPVAAQVYVTPLHADDWEILSIHAGEVEANMLSQIRAARTGQRIAVQVGRSASTVVRFTVDRTEPETGEHPAAVAVRLSTDTEVIVAPKTRHVTKEEKPVTAQQDDELTPQRAAELVGRMLWRVLPQNAVVSEGEALAWSVVVPQGTPKTAFELISIAFPGGKLCITKAPCPNSPQEGVSGTANATFVPGGAQWPEQHIWIGPALREKLALADLDMVRLSAASPGASRERPPTVEPQVLTIPPVPTPLAGMNALVDRLVDIVRGVHTTRAIQALQLGCMDELSANDYATPASEPRPYVGTSALLLTGGQGAGKSTVCETLATRVRTDANLLYHTTIIDCEQFVEERMPLVRARLQELLDEAAWHAPSLLVLDNLDALVPADTENVDSTRATQLASALADKVRTTVRDFDVFVVATAESSTSISSVLQSRKLWTESVAIKPPGKSERKEMLAALVGRLDKRIHGDAAPAESPHLNLTTLVAETDGYLAVDLNTLVERALHQATIRCPGDELALTMDDFAAARDGFTPLSLRNVHLEQSSVSWADIGGLRETRQTLRETLEWPTKYAAIFASCPLRLRSGLLLYGYPGCGKTMLASAVAKETGLNFISVKGPEILNKYIGASEKSVRDLFDRAQAAKPCVLFFDEFDSIAPKRGHDSTGVTDRVVNQMLTQMDGAEGLDGVYVLAATSRPDLIDSALLRPGRLDKSLLCDMPSVDDRREIIEAIARKVPLADDVDVGEWARRTEGFSGADLQALLYNAHLETISAVMDRHAPAENKSSREETHVDFVVIPPAPATFGGEGENKPAPTLSGAERSALTDRMRRVLGATATDANADADNAGGAAGGGAQTKAPERLVTTKNLESAFRTTRPSVPAEEYLRLKRIYTAFSGDREAEFPDGTPSSAVGARSTLM